MTRRRRILFRATWGSCLAVLFLPTLVPMSMGGSRLFAIAGILLFVFGIIQAVRNELDKGERLNALARGECPTCGYDLTGLDDGAVCPECGEAKDEVGT